MVTAAEAQRLVADCLTPIRAGYQIAPSDNGCFLVTPFFRPDGEGIELELTSLPDGRIHIADMGDTLAYLYVNGMTLNEKLLATARDISKARGATLMKNELSVDVKPESIGAGIHIIVQASLGVTNLIQKWRQPSKPSTASQSVQSA